MNPPGERRKPINKFYPFAVRLKVWTPDGYLSLEGPSTKEGCAAIINAALDNCGKRPGKKGTL